jgi:hypothetical protein
MVESAGNCSTVEAEANEAKRQEARRETPRETIRFERMMVISCSCDVIE